MAKKSNESSSKKKISNVKNEIKVLKKELEKTKNVEEKKDYNEKIKQIIDNKIQLNNLNNEIKNLREKLTKTPKTKSNYNKKLKELTDNKKALSKLKKEIKNLKEQLKEKTNTKKNTYDKGIKELINNKTELVKLTTEIKDLKKELSKTKTIKVKTAQNKELRDSMDNLSMSMGKLVELFTTAKDIAYEPYENQQMQKNPADLKPLVEQNRIMAKGILAITEMLREYLPKISSHRSSSEPRIDRKYKILRVNKKTSNTPLPIQPVTREEPNLNRMRESGLPSVPETDDDFEFSQGNEEETSQ